MKKKNIRRFTALSISFLTVIYAQSALAASLAVKIRQLNPDGAAQQVTCSLNKKCHVPPLVIEGGPMKKESLDVSFDNFPDSLIFAFKTSKGYLYAADKNAGKEGLSFYNTIWPPAPAKGKPATYNVTLVLPAVERMQGPLLNIASEAERKVPHETVANLEITIEPRP